MGRAALASGPAHLAFVRQRLTPASRRRRHVHRVGRRLAGSVERDHAVLVVGTGSRAAVGVARLVCQCRADSNLYLSKRHGGDVVTRANEEETLERFAAGGFSMLDSLVAAVDNKNRYTRRHSEDVTSHALMMAEYLGLGEDTQRILCVAGLLHDLGQIGVPDALLRKPGRLSPAEYEIFKPHAALGASIIQGIPDEEATRSAIVAHHEHGDGRGFPAGTKGLAIPQLGRIVAVADAYSAMTSDRPYRKALTRDESLAELKKGSGTQFDPEIVSVFLLACGADEDDEECEPDDADDGRVVGVPAIDGPL